MTDLDEFVETPRTPVGDDSGQEDRPKSIHRNSTRRKGIRKRQNSRPQSPPLGRGTGETRNEREGSERALQQQPNGQQQGALLTQDREARFYDNYRKLAEEYDKDFLKKYGEDLDTTLIFAGLFSAVTSAFIIEVDSKLQPDPGDETAALLRVLIYKIDNTTFGNDVPILPQWNGPPPAMIHVQTLLFASLAASLFSAFMAVLGKQWLNRYDSSDMRGSAIERSHHRQRKLRGMAGWYFGHVMESLSLMLQVALLLLGCALSRYLWEVSIVVASVVLGVTSFGMLFYLFIVIAGGASESCPYQTPTSLALRHLRQNITGIIRPKVANRIVRAFWNLLRKSSITVILRGEFFLLTLAAFLLPVLSIPLAITFDVFHLGWAVVRELATRTYNLVRVICSAGATLEQRFDKQETVLDLSCISWTLQTSLDKDVRLLAVEYLTMKTELTHFDPTLVVGPCFDVFVGCISISGRKIAIMQDKGRLAAVSATCLLRSLHHLSVMDQASSVLADIRQRYSRVFPLHLDFADLPFHHTMTKIHSLAKELQDHHNIRWDDYRPSGQEYITFAWYMVEAARVEYRQTRYRKVPRWVLRFALHSLSLDPPPPVSVIADCLTIVAIELGCQVSGITDLEESARVEQASSLITHMLKIMIEAADPLAISAKVKAITTTIPFAISLELDGQHEMLDVVIRALQFTPRSWGYTWFQAQLRTDTLFEESSTPSLNRAIALISPYRNRIAWEEHEVARWATAVLAIPYTEQVGRSVVDATLQIASSDSLRPRIPIGVWALFKNQPSLPSHCWGRAMGAGPDIIRHVQGLGDCEILKSYFILVWSEWRYIPNYHINAAEISIREAFCETDGGHHLGDLVRRVDQVLGELGRGLGHFRQRDGQDAFMPLEIWNRKQQYGKLKRILLEVEREAAVKTLPS